MKTQERLYPNCYVWIKGCLFYIFMINTNPSVYIQWKIYQRSKWCFNLKAPNRKLDWCSHKWLQMSIFHLYAFASTYNLWKFDSQKTQLNRRTFHNRKSYFAYWHIKMCTLIRHTICESLAKIQYFRHEWSSKTISGNMLFTFCDTGNLKMQNKDFLGPSL